MNANECCTAADQGDAASYRDWKDWGRDDFGRCGAVQARYFEAELARAGVDTKAASFTLVEIGLGNGSFAAWSTARGYEYTGTELDPELVERARQSGWNAFPATLDLAKLGLPSTPQCIVAWDVLEHLETQQIMDLLGSAAEVLADRGTFIARIPSGDSPFGRHIQHGDVTHCSILGSSAMRQLALTAGLEVLQLRPPVLPVRGVGLRRSLRRLAVLAGRAAVAKVIRAIFQHGRATVITANMVVVLRKPAPSAEVPGQ